MHPACHLVNKMSRSADLSEAPEQVRNFTLVARLDWLVLIAFTFPHLIGTPAISLIFGGKYWLLVLPIALMSAVQASSLFLICILLAIAVDRVRGALSVPSQPVPSGAGHQLARDFEARGLGVVAKQIVGMRVAKQDLSLGAHVRGVLSPYIVISGGMLVGLLKRDPRAEAIFFHEVAHILHGDRVLLAFLGLTIVQAGGDAWKLWHEDSLPGLSVMMVAALRVAMLLAFCTCVSRYREFYADAQAVDWLRDKEVYASLLSLARERPRGLFGYLFHPAPPRRLDEVRQGHTVLQRAIFWKLFWGSSALISWLQIVYGQDLLTDFETSYIEASGATAAVLLFLEVFRGPLLKASTDSLVVRTVGLLVSRRMLSALFLITGMMSVLYVSVEYGGEWSIVLSGLGGVLVFRAFRAMRPAAATDAVDARPAANPTPSKAQEITAEQHALAPGRAPTSASIQSAAVSGPSSHVLPSQAPLLALPPDAALAPQEPAEASGAGNRLRRPSLVRRAFKWTLFPAACSFLLHVVSPDPYGTPAVHVAASLFSTLITGIIFFFIVLATLAILRALASKGTEGGLKQRAVRETQIRDVEVDR